MSVSESLVRELTLPGMRRERVDTHDAERSALEEQNEMLRQEVRVARQAADITAQLVIQQFEKTDHALQRLQRTNEYLNALQETILGVVGRLDLADLLETIVTRAGALVGTAHGYIYLLEPDRSEMVLAVGTGALAASVNHRIKPGEGLAGQVWQTGQPLVMHNYNTWTGRLTPQQFSTLRAVTAVPLKSDSVVVGTIGLAHVDEQRKFGENEVEILTRFAGLAAVALGNARLFEAEQSQRRVAETLKAASLALSQASDLDTVLETMLEYLVQLVPYDSASVMLSEGEGCLVIRATRGHDRWCDPDLTETLSFDAGETSNLGRILNTRESFVIPDTTAEPRWERNPAGVDLSSWMGVPLVAGDRVVGMYSVGKAEAGFFTSEHAALAEMLAAPAAVAIENARLFAETEKQRQYSHSLLQNAPAAIISVDGNGHVSSWNPGAERLFGYTQAEAQENELDSLVTNTPQMLARAREITRETMDGSNASCATQRSRRDGTLVDVEISSVPAIVAGQDAGLVVIYHDITELKRTEEELRKAKTIAETATRAKSAFLATMSHEIRTPMNAIIGMTGLLLDTPLNADQREFAETVRNSGDALLTIINDILDFSKMEAGKMDLEEQPFDLRECVESALDLMKLKAAEKGLELACEITGGVPHAIIGDVTRLRQVLANLLSNAVKFTKQGEVVVTVERRGEAIIPGQASPRQELHFAVRDTGIGIPSDRLNRLFQAFSQVDSSTTRKYGGTGLGLAVSKRLSEMMGGAMWVESEGVPGKGSVFHFTIRAEAATDAQVRPALQGDAPELRGRSVLIVDDNATNRRILTLQTQGWGMQAQATGSPEEALEWTRRGERIDLAILDLHMPEMDGVDLAEELKRLPGTAESVPAGAPPLPLVLLSSLGSHGKEIPAGLFAACLTKPVRTSALFDTLLGIFAGQPAHAPAATPARPDVELAQRNPLRILIAEDYVVNQKLALRLLAQMGYRADVASNGLETIQALERQPYDVVLMDVQMPEMDGLEATRQICERWPGGARPRIIAMTANAMEGDREECLAAGMDDYVSKPIRVSELVEALARCQPLAPGPAPA